MTALASQVAGALGLLLGAIRGVGRNVVHGKGLAALSIGLSATLWVVVSNELNPPRIDVYPNQLAVEPINVPAGFTVLGNIDSISVRIAAPSSSWDRLRDSGFRVTVDLSNGKQGVGEYPVHVDVADAQARLIEVIPDQAAVRLERITNSKVPIRVNIADGVPFGYQSQPPKLTPTAVNVIGPEVLVKQVEAAVADVRLEGVRVSLDQLFKLTPVDVSGVPVGGVRVDPQTVQVQIAVDQQLFYRVVPVVANIVGEPDSGYWVQGVVVDPSTVTIVGDRGTVQDLQFVSTAAVDLAGTSETFVRSTGLALPAGVSSVGGLSVRVRVAIGQATGTRGYSLVPTVRGLASGLHATVDPVDIVVSGPLAVLRRGEPPVELAVDASGLEPGRHDLALVVNLSEGLRLSGSVPSSVIVTVEP